MENTRVDLGSRSYDVRIGSGLLSRLGKFARSLVGARKRGRAIVIADSTVARLYGKSALTSLAADGFDSRMIRFRAGESSKTLATYGRLLDRLLSLRPPIDRSTLIVGLGGGVTLDLAGFVAATALRGLDFLACPTTLLADTDAAIGGKTAVNHRAGKNLIGVFQQPRGVLIDVDTLKTLPRRQIANGLAECVKHAVIRDEPLLAFMESNVPAILSCKPSIMTRLIAWNVKIKAAVVSADEREAGQRAHLNFGHTIGHAIESLVGYDKIGHGEAVSLGMAAACELAVNRGLLRPQDRDRVIALLVRLGLPLGLADLGPGAHRDGLDARKLWRTMQQDKKNRGGRVRMVLPTRMGQVTMADDVNLSELVKAMATLESA
jgi:3-dehydroquinate synthase